MVPHTSNANNASPPAKLGASLAENIEQLLQLVGRSSDIAVTRLSLPAPLSQPLALIYTEGLTNQSTITAFSKLLLQSDFKDLHDTPTAVRLDPVHNIAQAFGTVAVATQFSKLLQPLISGKTIILQDKPYALILSSQQWEDRSIEEPTSESVVRGPKESFTETLRTNTALIRRKIRHPNLRLETMPIGRLTQTDIAMMYIEGLTDPGVVEEARSRLKNIDVDSILESGYIEEYIEDHVYSPFPTIYNSERPDVIAAELLEGKIAILIDGTPFVLVAPALLISFIHSPEDYYHRFDISSLIRILRFVGAFIALLFPSLYVAITTFHQEMIPTPLLISLSAQREGTPFPAFLEAVVMEVTFEILREAGLRMPRTIGMAVSVVGTLVIGQAAVAAGIVSAAMVIVVSMTAISSFIFPSYSLANAVRMLRFPLIALAASFGLVGVFAGLLAILIHISSLSSFGVPYTGPFTPLREISDLQDTVIRAPLTAMKRRPSMLNFLNLFRRKTKSRRR